MRRTTTVPQPWDIGRPQPAVVRPPFEGGFVATVFDAGCGTGENALHVAPLGLSVQGVDVPETTLATARGEPTDAWRQELAKACTQHTHLGPATLVRHDVSTLYFETDTGDGFREPGFSTG